MGKTDSILIGDRPKMTFIKNILGQILEVVQLILVAGAYPGGGLLGQQPLFFENQY